MVGALASWLFSRGDWHLAADELDHVLAAVPDSVTAYALRGHVEYEIGSAVTAKSYFDHARVLDSNDETFIQYYARYLLDTSGPPDQVEALLLTADKLYPANPVFFYDLAQLYYGQGRYSEAAPYFARLRGRRPDDPFALYWVSLYEAQIGDYSEAFRHIQLAIKILPREPLFYLALGDLLKARGDLEAAVRAYCAATKLGDDRRARERLASLSRTCY
jgi:tetratricopeptide (TPR) repeat protein